MTFVNSSYFNFYQQNFEEKKLILLSVVPHEKKGFSKVVYFFQQTLVELYMSQVKLTYGPF